MNTAAKMVSAFFESRDIKLSELSDDLLMIGAQFEGGTIRIYFSFDDSCNHVHVEGREFIKVPAEKYDAIYKTLNECNDQYLYIKFVLDTEGGMICARDDEIIQLESCGEECFELMYRMVKVVEYTYPIFMKALYA